MNDNVEQLKQFRVQIRRNEDKLIKQGAYDMSEYAEIATLLRADDTTENILLSVQPKIAAFVQQYLPHADGADEFSSNEFASGKRWFSGYKGHKVCFMPYATYQQQKQA